MKKGRPTKEKEMDTITTTISLDREVYRRLKHQAVDEDSDARAVIRRAVVEYLEKHGGKR
jgi:predicted transcriptional regulator